MNAPNLLLTIVCVTGIAIGQIMMAPILFSVFPDESLRHSHFAGDAFIIAGVSISTQGNC